MKYNDNGTIKEINIKASDTLPIGSIIPFCGVEAPSGWLFCNGSQISRASYSELFDIIGTQFGEGDGSTTFNLPDLRGKVITGLDNTQDEFKTLGKTGGAKIHNLTTSEIPSHTHMGKWIAYGNASWSREISTPLVALSRVGNTTISGGSQNNLDAGSVSYTNESTSADNPVTNAWIFNTFESGGTGNNQPHNNLQPYLTTNYIIKAKQSVGVIGKVLNNQNESLTDTYSCNYVNDKFDGTSSMGNIIVEDVICKNLADIEDFVVDGLNNVGARYVYDLKPNTVYTLSFTKTRISGVAIDNTTIYDVSNIYFYNGNTSLSHINGTTTLLESGASKDFSITMTTPDDCDNIRIAFFNNNGDKNANTEVSRVQLELGSVVTNYVEHKDYANDFSNLLQCVYKKTTWGDGLNSTGININGGDGGKTYLVCWSTHSTTGDNTTSYIGMLRCGYNGNNYRLTDIVRDAGASSALNVAFSINEKGILQFKNTMTSGASKVSIYQLT